MSLHGNNRRLTYLTVFIFSIVTFDFLAIRIFALLNLAWSIYPPTWLHWIITALSSIIFMLFYESVMKFFRKHILVNMFVFITTVFISFIFCVVCRRPVIEYPLAGSLIYLGIINYCLNILGASILLSIFLLFLISAVKKYWTNFCIWLKTIDIKDIIFILLLLLSINIFAYLYIKNGATVYYWDTAGYWQISWILADAANQGILHLLSVVYHSILTLDYNYLIALAWTPLVLIVGPSRLVFIEGIVNFGLFPLLLLIYFSLKAEASVK